MLAHDAVRDRVGRAARMRFPSRTPTLQWRRTSRAVCLAVVHRPEQRGLGQAMDLAEEERGEMRSLKQTVAEWRARDQLFAHVMLGPIGLATAPQRRG